MDKSGSPDLFAFIFSSSAPKLSLRSSAKFSVLNFWPFWLKNGQVIEHKVMVAVEYAKLPICWLRSGQVIGHERRCCTYAVQCLTVPVSWLKKGHVIGHKETCALQCGHYWSSGWSGKNRCVQFCVLQLRLLLCRSRLSFFLSLSFCSVILLYTLDHTYRATCLVCPGTQRDSLREETQETETTGSLHSALLSVVLVVARVLCFDVCH